MGTNFVGYPGYMWTINFKRFKLIFYIIHDAYKTCQNHNIKFPQINLIGTHKNPKSTEAHSICKSERQTSKSIHQYISESMKK